MMCIIKAGFNLNSPNIGKVVEVMFRLPANTWKNDSFYESDVWWCKGNNLAHYYIGEDVPFKFSDERGFNERWLIPISDPDIDTSERDVKEKEHA